MGNLNLGVFFVCLSIFFCRGLTDDHGEVLSWNMHDKCGQTVTTHGGVLNFNAARLRQSYCRFTVNAVGPEDVMISLYFTSFNVTGDECLANITIEEPGVHKESTNPYIRNGLYKSICKTYEYLVEYSMFTTEHRTLIITYTSRRENNVHDMKFSMNFAAFSPRVKGCTPEETERGMFSCETGRCVDQSLLCKDLNPCGDNRDCNVTSAAFGNRPEEKNFNYVTFLVVTVVIVFAVFALIQITLMVRNKNTLCQPAKKPRGEHLDAEFMPVNGGVPSKQTAEIELLKS